MSAKQEHAAPEGKLAANVAKAEQLLARFARDGVRHFIDGAPRAAASGRTFATQSPVDDRVLAQVAAGDAQDVAAAADAAQRAFPAWSSLPTTERARWMERLADALEARLDDARAVLRRTHGEAVSGRVLRAYRLYLAGCAMSFERGWIALHQILAIRPDGSMSTGALRGAQSAYPFTRDYIYR